MVMLSSSGRDASLQVAAGIKFSLSSIFRRPDSWNTRIIPDPSMLRKFVRDRNCRPVLRGILESLLHYLTEHLPKWSTRNRNLEELVSGRNTENKECPKPKTKTSMKETEHQTSSTMVQIPEELQVTPGKTSETSSKVPEKHLLDPRKNRLTKHGEDQRGEDLIPRRLTTFQLLQSKFLKSTPKPAMTHQREVGTLTSGRGVAGKGNHNQDSRRDSKREHGLKRGGGSVKDMVAKFAMAEQKERGLNMVKKQSIKPNLIGKGVLSSLMEKFETMATVCKGSDLKCSHEKESSGGVKVASSVKEKIACHESGQQQGKSRTDRPKSKSHHQGNQITSVQQKRPEETVNMLTNTNSNLLDKKDHLKAEQMVQQPSDQKADSHCSFICVSGQLSDNNVKDWLRSDESQRVTDRLKYARLELLCFTSVTEWSPPEPHRLLPQVETPLQWHVATIMTRSSVLSTCVDSSPKQYQQEETQPEPSEKVPNLNKDICHEALQNSDNKAVEDSTVTLQKRLPKYVIPRVYQRGPDRTNSSQSTPDQRTVKTPLVAHPLSHLETSMEDVDSCCPNDTRHLFITKKEPTETKTQGYSKETKEPERKLPPSQLEMSMTALNSPDEDVDTCPPNDTRRHFITEKKPTETETQGRCKEIREEKENVTLMDQRDVDEMQQRFRLPADAAFDDKETFAVTLTDIKPEREMPKQKPKYTTINYGDPSVKQVYKPKIIRFTDTFTF